MLHTPEAMAIYHILSYMIGFVTLVYASLAVARLRPARRRRR